MRISREKLLSEAAATGFSPAMLEKVIHLLHLLERINRHPSLKDKFALKGGTALAIVLPLNDSELAFLNGILDKGDVEPNLITRDGELAGRLTGHPGLAWKALNVRKYKKGGKGQENAGANDIEAI